MDRATVIGVSVAGAAFLAASLYSLRRAATLPSDGAAPAAPASDGGFGLPGFSLDFGLGLGTPTYAGNSTLDNITMTITNAVGLGLPRGIRNKNPGNVRRGPDQWQGLAPADEQTDSAFWVFSAPEYGVRVIAYILKGYQSRKGKRTVRQLISEPGGWAPTGSADKNPATYADFVAEAIGVGVDTSIDLANDPQALRAAVVAIVSFENGGYAYPSAIIDNGIALA